MAAKRMSRRKSAPSKNIWTKWCTKFSRMCKSTSLIRQLEFWRKNKPPTTRKYPHFWLEWEGWVWLGGNSSSKTRLSRIKISHRSNTSFSKTRTFIWVSSRCTWWSQQKFTRATIIQKYLFSGKRVLWIVSKGSRVCSVRGHTLWATILRPFCCGPEPTRLWGARFDTKIMLMLGFRP